MAVKPKQRGSKPKLVSPPTPPPSPPSYIVLTFIRASSSLLLPPLAAHLLLRSLPPLFGHSPSHAYTHVEVLAATLPLLALLPRGGDLGSAVAQWLLAGMCAGASWWVRLVGQRSGGLGVIAGPVVNWAGVGVLGLLVGRDALYDSVSPARTPFVDPPRKAEGIGRRAQMAGLSCACFWAVEKAWGWVLPASVDAHVFELLKIVSLLLFLSTFLSLSLAPRRPSPTNPSQSTIPIPTILLPLALLPLLLSLPTSPPPVYSGNVTLSKVHSRTGLIIVGESKVPSGQAFRYLRADHSLLGGRWIVDGAGAVVESVLGEEMKGLMKGQEEGVGESIFSAFVLQEAVRLVNRGAIDSAKEENALIIGLGVGIAARSLIQHNVSTTIVEYDSAVYQAARDHFFLPEPAEVFLEDANAFVQREADSEPQGKYDLVIHDVFTGGSVPGELFSIEFWYDLRVLMTSDGALAVNFAGIQKTESASLVIRTLLHVFPACRGFRDSLGESADHEDGALKNLVIFCSATLKPQRLPPMPKQMSSPSWPKIVPRPQALTFRKPVEHDYLGSYLRQKILGEFEHDEVDLVEFASLDEASERAGRLLWRGEAGGTLDKLQRGSGVATWTAMRELMPVEVWNSW